MHRRYAIGLDFLDSLYFSVQSFLTVGFGTPAPTTQTAQGVLILLSTGGIILFAVTIAFTRLTALDSLQRQYQRQEKNLLARLTRNKIEAESNSKADSMGSAGDDSSTTDLGVGVGNRRRCLKEEEFEGAVIALNQERNLEFRSEVCLYPTSSNADR